MAAVPLSPGDRDLLDRIFARLFAGDPTAVADLDAFERRHPDRLETVRTVAWGLACVRDWTAGWPAPAFDAAQERAPVADRELDYVACFIALPPTGRTMAGGELRPALDRDGHHALIRNCFAAIRHAAPAARRVLLTNAATPLPDDLGADAIIRDPIRPESLMRDRLAAYRRHLDRLPTGCRGVVFVDPDVVACRSPAIAFDRPFGLGLTWRHRPPTMPINGGVLFARATPAARWLLDRALDCYAAVAGEPRVAAAFLRLFGTPLEAWYGDQVALAALAGWRRFQRPEVRPKAFGPGATLGLLPCDAFNRTIDGDEVGGHGDAVMVHFKGRSKDAQAGFVRALIGG